MNPPFTNRANMGEKFAKETQKALRTRADSLEQKLTQADPALMEFADKNSIGPLFVGLADHCVERFDGILTMINPDHRADHGSFRSAVRGWCWGNASTSTPILTSHQPRNINLQSAHASINESIVVMRRHDGDKPPTRFINLDRMPDGRR